MTRRIRRLLHGSLALTLLIGTLLVAGAPTPARAACRLDSARGRIERVIHIQFDNTHFRRDNPHVPSDLEQMPHLLNFIRPGAVIALDEQLGLAEDART